MAKTNPTMGPRTKTKIWSPTPVTSVVQTFSLTKVTYLFTGLLSARIGHNLKCVSTYNCGMTSNLVSRKSKLFKKLNTPQVEFSHGLKRLVIIVHIIYEDTS